MTYFDDQPTEPTEVPESPLNTSNSLVDSISCLTFPQLSSVLNQSFMFLPAEDQFTALKDMCGGLDDSHINSLILHLFTLLCNCDSANPAPVLDSLSCRLFQHQHLFGGPDDFVSVNLKAMQLLKEAGE